MDHTTLLWRLGPLEPLRETLGHVLLEEPAVSNARRIALHRDRTPAEIRHHNRRDRLVIPSQLTLGNARVREQHLLRMRNHNTAAILSHARSLFLRKKSVRGSKRVLPFGKLPRDER